MLRLERRTSKKENRGGEIGDVVIKHEHETTVERGWRMGRFDDDISEYFPPHF
jgi:hypothetical protein